MKKSIIFLVVGIICAGGAILVVRGYLQKERQYIEAKASEQIKAIQENQTTVLVAKSDIATGATITEASLEVAIVPKNYVQPNAASSLSKVAGMKALVPISRGEQIILNKLTATAKSAIQEGGPRGLSAATPPGKRAVTISVDSLSSSAGLVKAGDFVDIFGLFPLPAQKSGELKKGDKPTVVPLFQNVLVLAVGKEVANQPPPDEKKTQDSPYLTVALTPKEANLLMFVQEQGKVRLVLRSGRDSQVVPTEAVSWEALMRYISPSVPQQPTQPVAETGKPVEPPPEGYIEVYRGTSKEQMPVTR